MVDARALHSILSDQDQKGESGAALPKYSYPATHYVCNGISFSVHIHTFICYTVPCHSWLPLSWIMFCAILDEFEGGADLFCASRGSVLRQSWISSAPVSDQFQASQDQFRASRGSGLHSDLPLQKHTKQNRQGTLTSDWRDADMIYMALFVCFLLTIIVRGNLCV